MARRHLAVNTGARRRAIVLGAIPLALAAGCSTSTSHPAAQSGPSPAASSPSASAPQPNTPALPDTATTPPATGGEDVAPAPYPTTSQPGVIAHPAGGGVVLPSGPVQPGVTTLPAVPAPAVPAPDYALPQNFRSIPDTEAAPALDLGELHAPTAVAPVAPIAPPPRTLRLGAYTTPVPDNVPDNVLDPANTAAADTEAALATGLNSVGINASRSDKIAGLTIAGAAAGAAIGAAALGVPAAVVGAVPGAVVGAGIGAVAGGIIGGVVTAATTQPEIGSAVGALAGAGIGAAAGGAAGAAITGVPAAVVGGVVGGIIGGAAGTAFGAAV